MMYYFSYSVKRDLLFLSSVKHLQFRYCPYLGNFYEIIGKANNNTNSFDDKLHLISRVSNGLESGRNHNDKRLLNLKQFQRQEKSVITSCCLCMTSSHDVYGFYHPSN